MRQGFLKKGKNQPGNIYPYPTAIYQSFFQLKIIIKIIQKWQVKVSNFTLMIIKMKREFLMRKTFFNNPLRNRRKYFKSYFVSGFEFMMKKEERNVSGDDFT